MRPLGTRRTEVALVSRLNPRKAFRVSKHFFQLPEIIMLRVCFLTTVAGGLMLLSIFLASYRRRSKSRVLKATLWGSYTLTSYLIAFTMGQMLHSTSSSSKVDYADNIIWALYLLIVFGSADSFSSYSLLDSDQWRRYNCQFVLKLWGFIILLVPYYDIIMNFTSVIILMMVLAIISKVWMKNQSIEASGTAALHRSCKRIVDYMITEHEVVGDATQADPSSMRGYRYLVQGEASKAQGSDEMDHVTLENVWNCRWELLSSRHTGDPLKDTCMSFSLYRLLRLKYAGYKLPREVNRKVFCLVRHGLMVSEENGYERAFRVVEDELALLFDSFYTKRPIIFDPRGHRLWLRFAESLFLGLVSSCCIYLVFVNLIHNVSWEQNWADGPYLTTSLIALVIYLLSEILQSFVLLFTTWIKVMFICKYVKGDLWLKRPFRRKCIERICKLCSFKPWERKLHQYSLLESYTYSPIQLFPKRFMYMFVDSPRDGQMECHPIDLSVEVRKAVFDCLKNVTESQSNDGIAYLRKPHVLWECDVDLELATQAEVIMVWHIATTMCSGQPSSPEGQTNFRVATTLSKYLAYLVAFTPRLLPDHPYLTESLFDQTIAEARLLFKGCKTVTERIDKLRESERESGKNSTTLIRGATLAKQLSEVKFEAEAIWETLANFWTEMLLYIAPSKDNRAHAEILAFGGEFVTHLWALLYHAGIERSKGSMPSHQRVNDMSDVADPSTKPMTSEPAVPLVSMEIDPSTMPMMSEPAVPLVSMEIYPSTMPMTSEPAVPPVSTEIKEAVVPHMITDRKQDLG